MRLRDKLNRLGPPPGSPGAPHELGRDHAFDRIGQLRALIGDVIERGSRTRSMTSRGEPKPLPVGRQVEGAHGPYHLVERFLEPEHCHGLVQVAQAAALDSSLVAKLALDPALERVDLSRMLIVDTETTGLAGGAGTVPFLIGLAFFEDGALKVEQLFLTNFGAEAPLLARLSERITQASCLLSYNGKSFDWPLLRSRYVQNRVAGPELPPHIDLLHCTRRVLKPRLSTVRLTEVERELLSFYRDDDIDGALIPGLYLAYLRGEDPAPLLSVIEHNDNDLVALAAILVELCRHFEEVIARDDPRDHLAYAKLAFRARDGERAASFASAAYEGAEHAQVRHEALRLTAQLSRSRGDVTAAVEAWLQVLADARASTESVAFAEAEAHLSLAKLYEHQLRDLESARFHARFTELVEGAAAQGKRLGRLQRRLLHARAGR